MFCRIRAASAISLLIAILLSAPALAKGGFDFISITGLDLKEELRSTDPALTQDFFAFADFYRDKTTPPADPGIGYEITRYYVDGARAIAFDRLHYYPDTGFVYYDGIINGESEYDDEWYTARPGIKAVFESALPGQTLSSVEAALQRVIDSISQLPLITGIGIMAGLAMALVLIFRLRRAPAS